MLPVTLNARLGEMVNHDPFAGPVLAAFLPLSEPQREVWLASIMEPAANLSYNEGLKLSLRGKLDVAALIQALQTILNRHEALRGVIGPDGRSMGVLEQMTLQLPVDDLSAAVHPAGAVHAAEEAEMRLVFDLERGPLVRFRLIKESDALHHLLFVAHHIVCDGWSSAVVITELAALYSAAVRGESLELYPPQRYGDYVVIEQAFLHSPEGKAHEAYWLQQLSQAPSPLDLPASKPRPKTRGYGANRIDVRLPESLVAGLRRVGAGHNASLVATVLAGFATLLHKLSGSRDLIIGLAAAGQAMHNQLKLVGHCVNLLPLRLKPEPDASFVRFLGQARKVVLDAFDHQGTTFGSLLPKLDLVRDETRPPLVNVLFNIDVRNDDIRHEGLEVSYETMTRRGENFDLFINAVDNGRDLLLEASYNADIYNEADIRQRMAEFQTLLEGIVANPKASLIALPWLPESLLAAAAAFNNTAAAIPERTVAEQISAIAASKGDAVAVQVAELSTSYAALEARAKAIAQGLAERGVAKGQFVGVCMNRTAELVASLLAVLKLGAVFAPLDPEVPAERLSYYLKDCDATLLLVDADTERLMQPGCPVLRVDSITADGAGFVSPTINPQDPAYVIYTSGSTGQPKGVVANHRGFVNVLASWNETLHLSASDRMAAVASISFDMAIVDFWAPLVAGATLVLFDRDTARDGELLSQALAAQSVNVLQATPASWRMLVQAGWQGAPNFRMVTGGEALARDLAENLLSRCAEVWNGYGPTETTVYSTLFRVEDAAAPILIGKPLANTQCHVLDAELQPMPPGVVGQLFIGGAGLANGYHNRPELTAASFIEHPSLGRLYRTGDLVRLTADGLDYLGRNDFQVKVRGYRIELGEIEYALSRHPLVAEATVQVREKTTGDARIVTWVAQKPDGPAPTVNELRQSLRGFLPGYMIPAEFVVLAELPRLPNGKLNRAGLPDPFGQARAAAQRRPPQTANEHAIAAVWAKVLGLPLERIGLDDRFLELGGHSLLATQAAGQIRKAFNSQLALRTLMMDPLAVIAAQLPEAPADAVSASAPKPASVTSTAERTAAPTASSQSATNEPEGKPKPKGSWLSKLLGDS